MKTSTHVLLGLVCTVVLLSSCSKDKMLERNLHKKEGAWRIDQINWTIVQQSDSGQSINMGTTYDAGTFTFDKGGSGSYSYKIDTISRSGTFTWDVDDETVSIASVSQSFDFWNPSYIIQKAVAYSGTQSEKDKLTLDGSETEQEVGSSFSQFSLTGTFHLTKK